MERIYINNNSKLQNLMVLSGVVSPINTSPVSLYNYPQRSSGFDLRVNSGVLSCLENLDSPIVRYNRSGSPRPKSPIVFSTPVKVMEDVVVMDGVLVGPVSGGRDRSLSMSDSGGSSSSGGNGFYKTEICRQWEDFGSCRYGAKCQFAHGKEERRPTRFSNKSKLETQICNLYTSGSCSYGFRCRFIHQQNNSPASGKDSSFTVTSSTPQTLSQSDSSASATDSPVSVIPFKTRTVSPIKQENAMNSSESSTITFARTDWSPLDDGIKVLLPCSSSTDKALQRDVGAYINSILYGSSERKTLPVFAAICPR
ncbi:C3H1-type domain-containing protein [Heracleum sosnowskyi]|uniref:C3H1-type domain-containing protein n=1 Tax=Heracleum sosnowskyi TaxID=360622 RepID=A0AAD8LWB1_9APIA|nr:C3H1-type domain-containing protein [Heracleum sosnowskyi]